MLFIFYLISKLFDDGQVVCAFVRRVNEWEACADGVIENWRNLVLSFFFSLSPSWGTGFHYECIAENDWLFLLLLFLNFGHLNATCCLLRNQTFTQFSDRQFVKDPAQPESARSGSWARAQRDKSGSISPQGHKTMTLVQQLLSNIATFNRFVRGKGTITLSKESTRKLPTW